MCHPDLKARCFVAIISVIFPRPLDFFERISFALVRECERSSMRYVDGSDMGDYSTRDYTDMSLLLKFHEGSIPWIVG